MANRQKNILKHINQEEIYMKESYEEIEMQVVYFEEKDIITESDEGECDP